MYSQEEENAPEEEMDSRFFSGYNDWRSDRPSIYELLSGIHGGDGSLDVIADRRRPSMRRAALHWSPGQRVTVHIHVWRGTSMQHCISLLPRLPQGAVLGLDDQGYGYLAIEITDALEHLADQSVGDRVPYLTFIQGQPVFRV